MPHVPFIECLASTPNTICRRCHALLHTHPARQCLECGAPHFPISDPLDDYFVQFTLSLGGPGAGLGLLLDFQAQKNLQLVDLKFIQADSTLDDLLKTSPLIEIYQKLCPLSRDPEILRSKKVASMAIGFGAQAGEVENRQIEKTWSNFREKIVNRVNDYVANALSRYLCIAQEIELIRDQLLLYPSLRHLHQCQVQTDIISSLSNKDRVPSLEQYLGHGAIRLGKLGTDAPVLKRLLYIENFAYNPNLRVTAKRIRLLCFRLSREKLEEELRNEGLTIEFDDQVRNGSIFLHDSTFFLEWLCQLLSPKADRAFMVRKKDRGPWLPKCYIRSLLNACPNPSVELKKWQDIANEPLTVSTPFREIDPMLADLPLEEAWTDIVIQNEVAEIILEYLQLFHYLHRYGENPSPRANRVEVKASPAFIEELRRFVEETWLQKRTDPRTLRLAAKTVLICATSLCFYFQTSDWTFDFLEKLQSLESDLGLGHVDLMKLLGEFELFWEKSEISFDRWFFHQKNRDQRAVRFQVETIGWIFFGAQNTISAPRTFRISEEAVLELFSSFFEGPAYRAHTLESFMRLLKWQAFDLGTLKPISNLLLAPWFWQLVSEHSDRREQLKFLGDGLQGWHNQFSPSASPKVSTPPALHGEWAEMTAEVVRTTQVGQLLSNSGLKPVLERVFPNLVEAKKSPSPPESKPPTEKTQAQRELDNQIKEEARKIESERFALQTQLTLQTIEAVNAQRKVEFEAKTLEFVQKMQDLIKNQKFDQIAALNTEKDRDLAAIQKKYDELIQQIQKSLSRS